MYYTRLGTCVCLWKKISATRLARVPRGLPIHVQPITFEPQGVQCLCKWTMYRIIKKKSPFPLLVPLCKLMNCHFLCLMFNSYFNLSFRLDI